MKRTNKKDYCVYFHINKKTNEIFYVGMGNKKRPYMKSGRNKWWNNIVQKYGYNIRIPYQNLEWQEAIKLEIAYIYIIGRIDAGGTLVNLTDGGDGAPSGKIPWNKGIKQSTETINKISKSLQGDKNFNYGKHFTIEHRDRISKSNKLPQVKPVCQYQKNGEFIRDYISILEASIITGFNKTSIGKCCRNIYGAKSVGGFIWKFKNK